MQIFKLIVVQARRHDQTLIGKYFLVTVHVLGFDDIKIIWIIGITVNIKDRIFQKPSLAVVELPRTHCHHEPSTSHVNPSAS